MAYQDEVLADNPLGYWRLGASATLDSSGNGYTLTSNGSPNAASGLLTAADDGSRDIDPDSDWYELASGVGQAADFDFEGTASFSLEAWVNLDTVSADFERIVAHETSTNGWLLYYQDAAGFGIGRQHTGFTLKDEVPGGSMTGLVYHLVGTYDGANLRLYINGSVVGTAVADVTSIAAYTTTLRIGRSPLGGTTGMDGLIDEVAIYDSVLSAGRVTAHYDAAFAGGESPNIAVRSALRW